LTARSRKEDRERRLAVGMDDVPPLVERLESMTQDLMRLAGCPSVETLRRQGGRAEDS
jgi:hypothetical protein